MSHEQLCREFLRIAAEVKARTLAVQGRIEAGIREAETWANEGER